MASTRDKGCRRETGSAAGLLTETEEEGVHTHGVHAEEPVGNEVGANRHGLTGERERERGHTWVRAEEKALHTLFYVNGAAGLFPLTRMGTQ